MQILCGIISFVVALAGIWTVTGYFVPGWATAVGVALVVIVSFAHAGTLAPESLGGSDRRTRQAASFVGQSTRDDGAEDCCFPPVGSGVRPFRRIACGHCSLE
jgi:hypothetical protein